MNRRSFIKDMALLCAAGAAGALPTEEKQCGQYEC